MKPRKTIIEKIRESVLRQEISHRGGGIEISLDTFGFKGEKMAAYQNYLGGGILGRICANDTIRRQTLKTTEAKAKKLDKIAEELKKYFHSLTRHEDDEWEDEEYESNQNKPVSAY
jgi:hypothetical protein